MFDDPKKELEKLEQQLFEDEEWFQRELDSAKRMIGQIPEKQNRPSAPRTPQAPKSAVKAAPAPGTGSSRKHSASQVATKKAPAKKAAAKKQKGIQGLLILACLEILGILALAAYWVLVLLK